MKSNVKTLRDKNYEKQLLLRDTNIKMLQQQINPHFLYNTLDTINWMAQKYGADDISTMVRSLGNLFRAAVNSKEDLIPLKKELDVLRIISGSSRSVSETGWTSSCTYRMTFPIFMSRHFVSSLW